MEYLNVGYLVLRDMTQEDVIPLAKGEIHRDMHMAREYFGRILKDQEEGCCVAITAIHKGEIAGYGVLLYKAKDGPFASQSIPELKDLCVRSEHQNKGIGTAMFDLIETLASKRADTLCLSIGLQGEYGEMQRMCARKGYMPNGSGAYCNGQPCRINHNYPINQMVLYMSRKLRR